MTPRIASSVSAATLRDTISPRSSANQSIPSMPETVESISSATVAKAGEVIRLRDPRRRLDSSPRFVLSRRAHGVDDRRRTHVAYAEQLATNGLSHIAVDGNCGERL